MIDYCNIYGDSDERELYLHKEPQIDVRYCHYCKMVLNRKYAIIAATKLLRWRKNRFFFSTLDGVDIAGHRFYELYHQYDMKGIEFIPFAKSEGYFACRFIHSMRFDLERAKQVYGVCDNGVCPVCGRSHGHHYPWPYRMVESDEERLKPNTFYRSDIEFAEDNFQHPLIWATDGIVQAFTKEKCRIFYNSIEGNFGKGDCGKP